jgi:hypothetical protein
MQARFEKMVSGSHAKDANPNPGILKIERKNALVLWTNCLTPSRTVSAPS